MGINLLESFSVMLPYRREVMVLLPDPLYDHCYVVDVLVYALNKILQILWS